jgi:hypothetical protein
MSVQRTRYLDKSSGRTSKQNKPKKIQEFTWEFRNQRIFFYAVPQKTKRALPEKSAFKK